MSKRKTRSQTLAETKRFKLDHEFCLLPDLPLLKILAKLENDDLVSLLETSKVWNKRLNELILKNRNLVDTFIRGTESFGEPSFWSIKTSVKNQFRTKFEIKLYFPKSVDSSRCTDFKK